MIMCFTYIKIFKPEGLMYTFFDLSEYGAYFGQCQKVVNANLFSIFNFDLCRLENGQQVIF